MKFEWDKRKLVKTRTSTGLHLRKPSRYLPTFTPLVWPIQITQTKSFASSFLADLPIEVSWLFLSLIEMIESGSLAPDE